MVKSNMADEMTYYELLGINKDSSEKEISRAYRKKALKCHPDKNPDNPSAAELFHKLSIAFEVIGNPKAKAVYDASLKAKERARLRVQAYDSKRKKFKQALTTQTKCQSHHQKKSQGLFSDMEINHIEKCGSDLEEREKSCQDDYVKDEVLVKNLEQEIERLREEGLKILQREQELIKQQIKKEREKTGSSESKEEDFDLTPKLKVRWKCQKHDATNGGYSSELLRSMFRKYGEIENLLVSSKKSGSAVIEFKDFRSAEMAVENEKGNPANPLKIVWLEGAAPNAPNDKKDKLDSSSKIDTTTTTQVKNSCQSNLVTGRDFESLVMRKLRQAEERKRLCEELANEDTS